MNTKTRKQLGGIVGEFLDAERQMSLAERSGRNLITEFLQKNDKSVEFHPSPYWEERIKAGDDEALADALMDESESVVFDRISEDKPSDGVGCLMSIGWNEEEEDVVAVVYVVPEKEEVSVHLGDIKSVVEVLRFLDAFA